MNKKKTIAVLGGSFDPIHAGHLQIARSALHMGMDEVWLMVTKDTPLKDRTLSSAADRTAMIERAIAPYRHIHCCRLELEREGKSYTIDTVRELKRRYPSFSFFWLIGSDQAAQLSAWKEVDALLEEVPFIVFSRAGADVIQHASYPLRYQPMELVDVSSSEIRSGQKWYALHPGVRRYIAQHHLYLESFVEGRLSAKRYAHSVRVAQLATELAQAHGLDETIAWTMGLLHDIAKEMPKDQLQRWMTRFFPSLCEEPAAIWHGYVGSLLAKRLYGIEEKSVLRAIFHHVKGDCEDPYAMILFCADKLERGRGYDSSEQIALCSQDLHAGFLRVKNEQQAYLKKEK